MLRYAWLLSLLLAFSRPSLAAPMAFCEFASLPALPSASDSSERLPLDELLNRVAQSYRGLLEFAGEDFSQARLEALADDSESVATAASPEKFFDPVPGRDQRSAALNESLARLGDWVVLDAERFGLTQEMILVQLREVVRTHLGQASQEQVRAEETREEVRDPGIETSTGAIFHRDTRFPELGEAYRDPDGMVWGDVVKNPDGTPREMSHKDALKYCQEIGAKLPSREDFARLREYLGGHLGARHKEEISGYKPRILPGLSNKWSLWSSSVSPRHSYDAYYFYSFNGYIYSGLRNFSLILVRCIKRTH